MVEKTTTDRTYREVPEALVGPGAVVNSLIGEGTRFRGDFDLEGLLRIDGDFEGSVRTKGRVLVGRGGRAACTINAGTVVIGGAFRGEIFATEKVIILSTGLVIGKITTPRLVVEEGVLFSGTCSVAVSNENQSMTTKSTSNAANQKEINDSNRSVVSGKDNEEHKIGSRNFEIVQPEDLRQDSKPAADG